MELKINPLDPQQLYRRECYSDNKAGTEVVNTPVRWLEGRIIDDPLRQVIYSGETMFVVQGQVQQLGFVIQADDFGEAVERFAEACSAKIREIQSAALRKSIAKPGIIIDGSNGRKPRG